MTDTDNRALLLDTLRQVETPEGVELGLRTAGVFVRAAAWFLDCMLRSVGYFVVASVLFPLGGVGVGFGMIVVFLAEWFYPVVFELLMAGATPGKRVFGLRVVHDNGTPVGLSASVIRNLLRFADFMPPPYLAGLLTMVVHEDFKRLGDIAAGTLVVHDDKYERRPVLPEAEPISPMVSLHQEEQRAVIEFAERSRAWSTQRAQELANIVEPLTKERGEAAVESLLGIAHGLVEGR